MNAQSLGSLRTGWSVTLDDCALSGGWTLEGNEFAVVDAAGGVSVFDGKRGDLIWAKKNNTEWLMVFPVDSPFFPKNIVQSFISGLKDEKIVLVAKPCCSTG